MKCGISRISGDAGVYGHGILRTRGAAEEGKRKPGQRGEPVALDNMLEIERCPYDAPNKQCRRVVAERGEPARILKPSMSRARKL